MRQRRSTPAQRRAAQRLKAIGASLFAPREAAGVAAPAEAGAPTPPALAAADPLPALPSLPVLGLGRQLREAIRRMGALGPTYPPGPPS
jgi:hypothetical protein